MSGREVLGALEAIYGAQVANWPTDPYEFLIWWHCGYPASDERCQKGWDSLRRAVGIEPEQLLGAAPSKLTEALRPGGMVPELRAMRLKEIAERVQSEFGGDLLGALRAMPLDRARKALKKFSNIADPGADRILLFAGISPIAAIPSNCPHVLVRIELGQERENYGVTYKEAQGLIEAQVPAKLEGRQRAYLLLKVHGQQRCKLKNPKCGACAVAERCAFAAGRTRGRARPTSPS
jgi:endonuclease-3